ncbi:sugar phosphate isomerase/epimerase family protein [Lacticaseibacillus mingshuiensis]|uniref:Sugar phosphate isomerase/epimerase family protein n=1 Tax=Lacticaseibacillus mingshuiensis TaxID=2799574 RepID=A0ABW4CGG3_9LACO|nr:sugar phosphate isomerase/epimerase [Lacticaseibacillus mingshuiensis]
MKLGVFTPVFNALSFDEMLDKAQSLGLEAIEIGAGGNPGTAHLNPEELLASSDKRREYLEKVAAHGLTISALSCHNNPISPVPAVAAEADRTLHNAIRLAELMHVPVVNEFSGVSGGNETDTSINWPTIAWPTEYSDSYQFQWEKRLVPYWRRINDEAGAAGVKIGIELHGGFLCHTPYTMLKLRDAAGENIGCNLDPSHMWWQGIDPVAAVKILGEAGALVHFHAKDTYLDQDNINLHGLTDMQPYEAMKSRAWTFRTVGYGHDMKTWSDMMSALRLYGYDYVVSIEHEDPLMSVDEGLHQAVKNLKSVLIKETPGATWWTGDTI